MLFIEKVNKYWAVRKGGHRWPETGEILRLFHTRQEAEAFVKEAK